MNLKVLHLISGGDTGGAKTHIFSLMEGLKDFVDAKIICFIEDTFYEEAKSNGIDIEVIPQKRRSDMSVVKKISDLVNDEHYDIVHCHGARANTIAIFLKSKINVPMITTIHSDYLLDFKDSFYKDLIFTPINTFALKRFDYYVAVTENFKSMLIDRGFNDQKIYTLYNGINMNSDPWVIVKDDFLKRYNIDYKGKYLVGQVARLDGVKNIKMTIRAAQKLSETRRDIMFLIAGDGEELHELQKLAKELKVEDMIVFLGFVKENMSFFNAIDLNILTSLSESFPYVILEASKMKKATIATNVGGINELIRDGVDGYLIESNDFNKLASRIDYLADNSVKSVEMGESIYNRVKESFSTESMAATQIEIYNNILSRRNL
ncbi:MAG: glycosyltransferase family 4 protein [Tissierellia bacterium]|nr:glycosyltransferase family 4 protein [Tissierellia bacterium]